MSDSVRPHRRQPTRLRRPWDSPGKNTGVGCHFLLQCIKVKSESEVTQSCPTHSDPMDCSLPGSSVHGIFQARVLEWGAIAFSELQYKSLLIEYSQFPLFVPCDLTAIHFIHPYVIIIWIYCYIFALSNLLLDQLKQKNQRIFIFIYSFSDTPFFFFQI